MASLWDDRLVEVWVRPGKPGTGVAVGDFGVLTARHLLTEMFDGSASGPAVARITGRGVPPQWVPMRVAYDSRAWDLAVLEVDKTRPEAAAWVRPSSPTPTVVAVGGASEDSCEAVGFPDAEVQHGEADRVMRQSEQLRGTLLPMGQGKPPRQPRPGLPRAWMPLDASTATPDEQAGWGGMSGAGVLLPDGRLVGLVVAAEAGHQQRRLYVVPLASALDDSAELAAALTAVTGAPITAQVRSAPIYRRVLYSRSLGADGAPARIEQITDLDVFGVKQIDLAGELPYLDYVPRDHDDSLRQQLAGAAAASRMLLLVGDSGAGKSRSAAEAVRRGYPRHRLVRPREDQLAHLEDLPVADLGPALVWLDDVEKYGHPGLRELLRRLLDAGTVVVGTVRRKELQALTASGEVKNPAGEALTDADLVTRLDWKREWSQAEQARTPAHVTDPLALLAVAAGLPLGVWAVAGPELVARQATADDEDYPSRSALIRCVLDWYRTGLTTPVPLDVATKLVKQAYVRESIDADDLIEAVGWCTEPIDIGGRRGRYSLLTIDTGQQLAPNDYIQDHDLRHGPPPIPDATWVTALASPSPASLWSVGTAAYEAGQMTISKKAFQTLAAAGDADGMTNLGLLLEHDDPATARTWHERAAATGNARGMYHLGLLLIDDDPGAARGWYERAAAAGETYAMTNLGAMLSYEDPAMARTWWERAAAGGNTIAMTNLGRMLQDKDPATARTWWERAATAGDADAMFKLGVLLHDEDPDTARPWWERAAASGNIFAMTNLGAMLLHRDPATARAWSERAAAAGDTDAMTNLGLLLCDEDPATARTWFERAAATGHTDAMTNLGWMLRDEDPATARTLYERAADSGNIYAMTNLGLLLHDEDPATARTWWERAAGSGHADAMTNLGAMLHDKDPATARAWYERAAASGHTDAMGRLAMLLHDEDPATAHTWWDRAAALRGEDPATAFPWCDQALAGIQTNRDGDDATGGSG